jgi:uncharacterized protein involved in cysteine biosynthesis
LIFWDTLSGWIATGLTGIGIQNWLEGVEPRWVAYAIQAMAHLILFVPLVFITALVITSLFAMPALIRLVEIDYAILDRRSRRSGSNGGSLAGSLKNSLIAIGVFTGIWFVTSPLWLIGAGALVPFIAATYLNQRLFRYDALSEHANPEEMKTLIKTYRSSWWALGFLTGLIQFVPILNLFAPALTGLTFIHFGLARLSELRNLTAARNNLNES